MGALTEVEIFDCLAENLRLAVEDCGKLAWHPRRGLVYAQFCRALGMVEGACQQAYYWRDYDARWLLLAQQVAEAQKRAGNWLRDYPSKDGRKVAHPMFERLGEVLSQALVLCDRVRTRATHHIGPIIPAPLPGPHRETRPVQVITPGGIILPAR
ncbi:MAG: hypothetical protein ACM3II_00100 [Rhodospirillaceae bacterium]